MIKKVLLTLCIAFLNVSASGHYIVSDEILSQDDQIMMNEKLEQFKEEIDIELYLDIHATGAYDFEDLNKDEKAMLLSIDVLENTWVIESTKDVTLRYARTKQKAFMKEQSEILNNHDFEKLVDNLAKDINEKGVIEHPQKEIFSIKRLAFSVTVGLLIALIMAQSNKNKLKTFRARSTAVSYLTDFKITNQKETLVDRKETQEYVDRDKSKVSSGKF